MRAAVREFALRGINMEPGIRKRGGPAQADNPDFYPIYEARVALDAPVMFYTSPFAGPSPYFANEAAPYDRLLRHFPKLKVILGHGGYPCRNLYLCQDVYTFWLAGHLYQREIGKYQDQFVFGTPIRSVRWPKLKL